jgi:hypothetical protein
MIMGQTEEHSVSFDVEVLRKKVNDERYLSEAVQRIALILSNELLGIPRGGILNERYRKGRK